ncbi:MAG: F0F1 ATP synthase subunit gamma [Desulfatibacillum sp.]|nr:F0F1 ATP synthase subunit gamma [Desulfatibacillum sp.]
MDDLESLKKRIKTAGDLLSVVKTMKNLAAVNIRHFEGAALSLEEYRRVVNMGWQALFRSGGHLVAPRQNPKIVLLVIGSDQGMCGQFNEVILQEALIRFGDLHGQGLQPVFWTAGEKIRAALEDEGHTIPQHFSLPGSVSSIKQVAESLGDAFVEWERETRAQALRVIHHQLVKEGGFEPMCAQILPLDQAWINKTKSLPWPNRCLPLIGMSPEEFSVQLFRQHIFVTIYAAFTQSMASENAARLRSMQAAEKNILEIEERLVGLFRETRQSVITAELLDIVSGFESLKDEIT